MPGLTGMKTMADECRFFNQVVPQFVPPIQDKTDKEFHNFNRYTCSGTIEFDNFSPEIIEI